MPFLVQFLQSDVFRTSYDGHEWSPKAIEVLGTKRPNDTHTRYISNEKVKARHMSRLAKTISNDGSLGRETMLSSLFTSHVVGPKILTKIGKVSDNGEGQYIQDPSGQCCGCAGTHSEQHRLGIQPNISASHCHCWVKHNQMYKSTATVSHSKKWPC